MTPVVSMVALLLARKSHIPTECRKALVSLDPDSVRFIGGADMLEDHLMDQVRAFLTPTD